MRPDGADRMERPFRVRAAALLVGCCLLAAACSAPGTRPTAPAAPSSSTGPAFAGGSTAATKTPAAPPAAAFGSSSSVAGTGSSSGSSSGSASGGSSSRGASSSAVGRSAPGGADWTTYHGNAARDGVDVTAPPVGRIARAWTSPLLDGEVYAEPLVVGSEVLVATEGDSLYALDTATGHILWHAALGTPVPGGQLPCGDINPSGITGTPVADPASGLVYAVTFSQPAHHELVALDFRTGAVRFRKPADPPGADPHVEQQRGALTLDAGAVYIPYGGLYGDCGAYHGWMVSLPAAGSGSLRSYQVPTQREGGIWAPPGAAVDDGSLFVATGNGSSGGAFDHGDSVIRLSPDLAEQGFFAPTDWAHLNMTDLDLGTTGPEPVAGGLIFMVGKDGEGYLLRAQDLGGIGGQAFGARVCSSAYGGGAYSAPYILVPCRDGLVALRQGSGPSFSVAWRGPRFNAGPPVVAGGAVFTIDLGNARLQAFALDTGHALFSAPLGSVTHFAGPAAAGGRLFAPAGRRIIAFSGI
jgi:outer membrane protein assembly factor BamB